MRVFLKIALVGALLLSACFCGRVNRTGAQRGVLDLREANLSVPIRLDGEWEFYWNHLYDPEKIPGPSPDFLKLPGAWNGARSGSETIGGDGFATLRLRLLTPAGAGPLMLKIPHQGTAYEMYADGHLIAKSGKVGTSRDSMTPLYVPRVSDSFSGEGSVDLVLRISNFHHRLGGPWGPIFIGKPDAIRWMDKKSTAMDLFLFGSLFIMALYHIGLFAVRKKDVSPLYFSLFCVLVAGRILLTGEKIFTQAFPEIPWETQIKAEYITFFLSIPSFFLFLRSLFPAEFHRFALYASLFFGLIFTFPVFFLDAHITSRAVLVYQFILVAACLYVAFVLVYAAVKKREGSFVFLAGAGIMIPTVIHDVLATNLIIIGDLFFPIGFFIFIFSQSFLLSVRFSRAFQTVEELKEGLEEKVKDRTARLEEASRQRTAFFQNISHELRTPLTLIIGPLESARLSGRSPDDETVDMVLRNSKRLQRLVNQLLDLQKITAGKMELKKNVVDLGSFLGATREAFRPYADVRKVSLELEVPSDLPPVSADLDAVDKCLYNFLSNALKFTPAGGEIVIRAFRLPSLKETGQVRVEVQDSGIGIPQEKLDLLFERFGYSESSLTREQEGTGLGLSLVRELVEIMGGRAGVSSTPGIGSVFYFTLPEAPPLSAPDAASAYVIKNADPSGLVQNTGRTETRSATSRDTRTVLIVDDSDDLRNYMAQIFSSAGYRILTAENGETGLRRVISARPDLVVTDLMMPRLSGIDMIQEIRKVRETKHIPIVLLTARADEDTRREVREAGADGYLAKPFNESELLATARNMIALKAREKSLSQDMDQARKIQNSLMPSEFPMRERVELAAVYEPTEKIGGDFYDFVDFPDGRLGMFIADVSGHGLPAAMIASIGKILLSVFGPNVESPGDLFFSLNSQLHERLASYFLTGFFGILSPDRALLSYATAGHPPPFLVREGAVRPLTGRGRPVGFWKNIEYETHDVKLLPGDRIVLYTDGLTEATNEVSRMYGEEGMIHSMESAAKSPLGFFLQKIIQDARQFQGGGVFLDDVTLVGVDLK